MSDTSDLGEHARRASEASADRYVRERRRTFGMPTSTDRCSAPDVVLSSLTIEYAEHLEPVFSEFRRVLREGGRLVLSTHHPFGDWEAFGLPNYYATGPVEDTWSSDGVLHRFHRRTMEDLLEALIGVGFLLERYLEALPPDAVLAAFPDADVPPDPFFLFLRAVPALRPSGR